MYGELGRLPLKYNIEMRMINFWFRLISGNNKKFSFHMYRLLYKLDDTGVYHSDWITRIKQILVNCNMYEKYWKQQENDKLHCEVSLSMFKTELKKNLRIFYENSWRNDMQNSSKCFLYREFKEQLKLEKYLLIVEKSARINLTRYRLSNHKLPIEIGRHNNIVRNERICELCSKKEMGDEVHYFLICPKFEKERKKLIPKTCIRYASAHVYCELLATDSPNTLRKLATISKIIMNQFI